MCAASSLVLQSDPSSSGSSFKENEASKDDNNNAGGAVKGEVPKAGNGGSLSFKPDSLDGKKSNDPCKKLADKGSTEGGGKQVCTHVHGQH